MTDNRQRLMWAEERLAWATDNLETVLKSGEPLTPLEKDTLAYVEMEATKFNGLLAELRNKE